MSRDSFLNDDLIRLFPRLLKNRKESDYVFLDTHDKTFNRIDTPFKDALIKAGIDDFRFHNLRHTFASHYIMCLVKSVYTPRKSLVSIISIWDEFHAN